MHAYICIHIYHTNLYIYADLEMLKTHFDAQFPIYKDKTSDFEQLQDSDPWIAIEIQGCPKLQVIFRKRATNYRDPLRKMTYKDKASYESLPLCSDPSVMASHVGSTMLTKCWPNADSYMSFLSVSMSLLSVITSLWCVNKCWLLRNDARLFRIRTSRQWRTTWAQKFRMNSN